MFRTIIMNPIKKKPADFLNGMSKKSIDKMDPKRSCAKSLQNVDREMLLKEDIQRICDEMSVLYRKEIQSMASVILKRMEKKTGKLNLPQQCRDLAMNS